MDDFLSEHNPAGQVLVRLCSRGNAILAELLRLSDNIPDVFLIQNPQQSKYFPLLFDFKYLKSADLYEAKMEGSEELQELDDEFKENHLELLERFYSLFESIYKYYLDLERYLDDLEEGIYIQHTLEDILINHDGKQLMAEAVYLYGAMLTLMDERIDGVIRERMLVSYYRYKGSSEIPNIDDVCKLCRSTGYSPSQGKRPPNYPEEFFARFKLRSELVNMVISRLRSDDVYSHMNSYPNPDHRSTALAVQAGMLYIILYFAPNVLNGEEATMREIVDKHFPDNWVISYFMGFTIDLTVAWYPYKAARAAISNTVRPQLVKQLCARHVQLNQTLAVEARKYLTEGVLVEEYVLDNIPRLLNCLRACNVTIRWLMLHRVTSNKKLRDVVQEEYGQDQESPLMLLLDTAQLEFKLKLIFKKLLDSKQERWTTNQDEAALRLQELSEYFTGEKPLTRVERNDALKSWFSDLATKVKNLDPKDSTTAGRKLQQLIQALEDVEQYHQIETSLQVKQFLAETRQTLHQMLRIVNVKEEVLFTVELVADLSYAWGAIINQYITFMHRRIRQNPFIVLKLRATFLKLASILDVPLTRINQANSPDLESVAEYYSGELVHFVRKVLQVIPTSMFEVLSDIVNIRTTSLKELPTKIEKAQLKDFAQLTERYQLARATHRISIMTEGILAMEKTLVGVIEVDPKKLLEDGIRQELVKQLTQALHTTLQFNRKDPQDFDRKTKMLANQLEGFRRSLEYIQDYVNIYGLKMWQEEFSRVMNFYVEQECNRFLKHIVYAYQSQYQSKAIPIPVLPILDAHANNFTGRLLNELLIRTDPRKTVYLDPLAGWYDSAGKEMAGIRTFSTLHTSMGLFGIVGIDKLLCFTVVRDLQRWTRFFRKHIAGETLQSLLAIKEEFGPISSIPDHAQKKYSAAKRKLESLWPSFLEVISKVGQVQLIRKQIANELNFLCQLDSNMMFGAMDTLNNALLTDVREHYQHPDTKPYPGENGNSILPKLSGFLETSGISSPLTQIYITTDPLPELPLVLFLFSISMLQYLSYDRNLAALVCKKRDEPLDGAPFVVGMVTILKQFHSTHSQKYLAYLGQYIRSYLTTDDGKNTELPADVINVLSFLEDFCKYSQQPRKVVEAYIPSYTFDRFHQT
eukprot:TRINITY_DN1155_c0_g1::TRINITY_DN1155_c0_g1_i1::g.17241::m.17241 TRINITY_DN1155_c0_g1::TRINITY_DN1155_c0_g1_i1::g.17241  ORF type:complete len:1147 (-),score=362.33,sp/Q54IR8/WASC5_DICDI/52.49/0.0,Strumpellin/PF10266.4/0 TRINITY_DN1155_c0_g1_i1:284-3724(-)